MKVSLKDAAQEHSNCNLINIKSMKTQLRNWLEADKFVLLEQVHLIS